MPGFDPYDVGYEIQSGLPPGTLSDVPAGTPTDTGASFQSSQTDEERAFQEQLTRQNPIMRPTQPTTTPGGMPLNPFAALLSMIKGESPLPPGAGIGAGVAVGPYLGGALAVRGAQALTTLTPKAITAIRVALPAVLTIAGVKALLQRFGPTIVKLIIGAAAIKEFTDVVSTGAPDDYAIHSWQEQQYRAMRRGKGKRLSIGRNPRLNTLLKVAKFTNRYVERYDKAMQKIRPRKKTVYVPSGALSPIEKRVLKRG